MFDPKKPTVQMLGRWQPWHEGHQELFKRCVAKTGQVIIQVRDVQGSSGGEGQDDNPLIGTQYAKILRKVCPRMVLREALNTKSCWFLT